MASNFLDSTIAQILEDIISQISFEGESHSNIADILLSILNQTPYDEEPKSVIADLFLKLKAKIEDEPFVPDDKEYTSNIAKILVSILNETEYTEEPKSRIAELLLELKEELESFIEVTVSGSVVSFTTKVSKPLVNLTADINPTETGTGEKGPENPYIIGGHTKINITNANKVITDYIYPIEPIQEGTGDPSPENRRPIYPGLTITRDDESTLEVYGGGLNVKTGELTVTVGTFKAGDFDWTVVTSNPPVFRAKATDIPNLEYPVSNADATTTIMERFLAKGYSPLSGTDYGRFAIAIQSNNRIVFVDNTVNTVEAFVEKYGNDIVYYPLATPTTIQLSATELERAKAALGIDIHTVKLVTTQESTKSGSVINISDSVGDPAKELTVDINAWQEGSGDPYPAGGSAQIWDEEWENGTLNSSGVPISDSSWIRSKNYSPIIGGNSYYVKGTVRTDIHWYDSEKSFIQRNTSKQNSTVTAPNTARFFKITTNTATYNNNVSINYPATDTSYHKYANERPIHGWSACKVTRCGKNLINVDNVASMDVDENGSMRNGLVFSKSGTYTIKSHIEGANDYIYARKISNGVYGSITYIKAGSSTTVGHLTIASGESFILWDAYPGHTLDYSKGVLADCQVELGSTDTAYEPYNGNTYNILFPPYSENLPYFEGLLAGTYGFVDLGTLDWRYIQGSVNYFRASLSDHLIGSLKMACPLYITKSTTGISGATDKMITCSNNLDYIYVTNKAYTDKDAFKTAMLGVYLIYELAEAVTPTITPEQYQTLLRAFAGVYFGGVLDVTNGVLNVTWGSVDLGSLAYNYFSVYTRFRTSAPITNVKSPTNNNTKVNALVSIYGNNTYNATATDNNTFGVDTNGYLAIHDERYTDGTLLASALNGILLFYELAEPFTVQLTPQQIQLLLDNNTLFADTGDMSIIYDSYSGDKVYGGEFVCEEGEFDKVYSKGKKYTFTGSETWNYNSTNAFFYTTLSPHDSTSYGNYQTNNGINLVFYSNGILRIYVSDNTQYIDSSTDMNTIIVNGTNFIYELATPTEITLPTKTQVNTLLGANNIYHDCNGDIEVTYLDKRS